MPLNPQLTHFVEQAAAAHNNGDPDAVQDIFDRMHRAGYCAAAHILIEELNRRSMLQLIASTFTGQPLGIQLHDLG